MADKTNQTTVDKGKRDSKGRFFAKSTKQARQRQPSLYKHDILEHNYSNIEGNPCNRKNTSQTLPKNVSTDGWKVGPRIVDLDFLLQGLRSCQHCRLGPVSLAYNTIVGELRKGLSGFLYVACQNPDCGQLNRVPYGKTHRMNKGKQGMPCFAINTKLGAAMVDNLGGAHKVNNMLAVLNLKTIDHKNSKKMEIRAGEAIQAVSRESCRRAAKEAFEIEMSAIARQEEEKVKDEMVGEIDNMGMCPLPGESPSLHHILQTRPTIETDSETENDQAETIDPILMTPVLHDEPPISTSTPDNLIPPLTAAGHQSRQRWRLPQNSPHYKAKKRLDYPCRTRTGMSSAVDTAWQKKGFDSLTSHTFFMTTNKAGKRKKVIKAIVGHRHCGKCKWWKRNRSGQIPPSHKCVKNHVGSARSMEASSGLKGVRELIEEGTPVEYLEGDGDNTLIARLKSELDIMLKKRFDKNHVVKNVTGALYKLKSVVKLSNSVITHIEKCLCYAFQKNQGDLTSMQQNLKALIPHQFSDHSICSPKFCGYKRNKTDTYVHRSLPYHLPLQDGKLRSALDTIFTTIADNAHQYVDLGSSQQCESANRSVSLRASKSNYYGDTKSLDYRVEATAACINEGRNYISQGFEKLGLSPGVNTVRHSTMQLKRRLERTDKALRPLNKLRRLVLKKERAVIQGANEAMEGDMYQSGIGHIDSVDIELVPNPIAQGDFKPVKINGQPTLVMFDFETTNLIENRLIPAVTQIAASDLSGNTFNVYVTPDQPITPEASTLTGISFVDGVMSVRGNIVDCFNIRNAMLKFLYWLEKYDNVVLCAHNGKRFDFVILADILSKLDLNLKCEEIVSACIETMCLFRKAFPGKQSLKQEDLAKQYIGESYDAHNAVGDVIMLGKLVSHANLTSSEIMKHSFRISSVAQHQLWLAAKAKNMPSLEVLIYRSVCKRPTAENIAGSGLALQHLRLIHQRRGEDGLRDTFITRVTKNKKILEEVIPKLAKFLE